MYSGTRKDLVVKEIHIRVGLFAASFLAMLIGYHLLLLSRHGLSVGSAGQLHLFHQVNGAVRTCLQGLVGLCLQAVAYRFQPFIQIAVLKLEAVELALFHSGGDAEIFHAMAWGDALYFVIDGTPHIVNRNILCHINALAPERVCDLYFIQVK